METPPPMMGGGTELAGMGWGLDTDLGMMRSVRRWVAMESGTWCFCSCRRCSNSPSRLWDTIWGDFPRGGQSPSVTSSPPGAPSFQPVTRNVARVPHS